MARTIANNTNRMVLRKEAQGSGLWTLGSGALGSLRWRPALGARIAFTATMPRDHRKLRVFVVADNLALRVYHATRRFPVEERYGLQSQIRRAALSVATNIVEGCARESDKEYGRFINVAFGSAAETHYLFSVVRRLELLVAGMCVEFESEYESLLKALNKLLTSIEGFE